MTTYPDDGEPVGGRATATLDRRLPSGRPSRTRAWLLALLGVATFLTGMVCGATAMHSPVEPRRTSWNDLLERVAKRMEAELDLNEAQQASLKEIVRDHQPKLDRIRASTIREMRAELEQVIEETAAILTPEQARRYLAAVRPKLDEHFPAEGAANSK